MSAITYQRIQDRAGASPPPVPSARGDSLRVSYGFGEDACLPWSLIHKMAPGHPLSPPFVPLCTTEGCLQTARSSYPEDQRGLRKAPRLAVHLDVFRCDNAMSTSSFVWKGKDLLGPTYAFTDGQFIVGRPKARNGSRTKRYGTKVALDMRFDKPRMFSCDTEGTPILTLLLLRQMDDVFAGVAASVTSAISPCSFRNGRFS